jgi:hypothetical protein
MKGTSACERFLLRKEPLEDLLVETMQGRIDLLLAGQGEVLLRQFIEEEIAAQGLNPRKEMDEIRVRLAEIDRKASTLLEGLSPDTQGFLAAKLRELGAEKRRIEARLDALQATPYKPIDPEAVLRDGLAALQDFPRLLAAGSLEERKELVHAFYNGVTVHPDENRLDLMVRPIPVLADHSPFSTVNDARGLVSLATAGSLQRLPSGESTTHSKYVSCYW